MKKYLIAGAALLWAAQAGAQQQQQKPVSLEYYQGRITALDYQSAQLVGEIGVLEAKVKELQAQIDKRREDDEAAKKNAAGAAPPTKK